MEETPKSRFNHLQRMPTPLLMTRRKSLFLEMDSPKSTSSSKSQIGSIVEQELDGIAFLDEENTSVEEVLQNASCLNCSITDPSSNTPNKYDNPPQHEKSLATPLGKMPSIDQELPKLLKSMSLKKSKKENHEDKENIVSVSAKRQMLFSPRKEEPFSKVPKLQEKKVSPIETKSFYSASSKIERPKIKPPVKEQTAPARIRKRRKTISKTRTHLKPTSIENILNTINSEKLRSRILAHREQKQNLERVHKILMESQNPIAMAIPLNVNTHPDKDVTCDFSDLEEIEEGVIEEAEVEFIDEMPVNEEGLLERSEDHTDEKMEGGEKIQEEPKVEVGSKRKFFKSKDRSNKKEVKLVGKMTAEFKESGKMVLKTPVTKKSAKKRRVIRKSVSKFHDEQVAVDDIIQNLDTTVEPSFIPFRDRLPYKSNDQATFEKESTLLDFLESNNICTEENFTVFIAEPDRYAERANQIMTELSLQLEIENANEFRSRIPYNTTDPHVADGQRSLLEFLISNEICNEENFQIFIADYENRKAEAEAIINQFIVSDSSDVVSEASSRITDAETRPVEEPQTFYPIFYPEKAKEAYTKLQVERTRKTRTFNAGFGANQYQIDAGQKEFGAKQCKDCGLTYTVHEPEEEKVHREYHDNLYVLRFKGWIDEVVVARFPKWSPDGRIIRLTNDDPIRRRERIHEILRVVVDKELGFSSYILPETYVVFLAIAKNKVIGLCLVQPLDKAFKYLCIDGVDCCSLESFDVSCGISRIWISPFHRRLHVGRNLINAVQSNTFLGRTLSMDEIAFSAPTEDGKKFAKSVSQREDFFVYQ